MLVVFSLGAADVAIYLLDISDDLRSHILNKQVDTILASDQIESVESLIQLPTRFSEADWIYTLYDKEGRLLGSSPASSPALSYLAPGEDRIDSRSATIAREVSGDHVLVIAKNDWLERGELSEMVQREITGSFLLIVVLGIVSLVAIYMLAKWTLKSVSRAAALAETIGADNSERRIPMDGLPLEIIPLAKAANTALDRLANAYSTERQVTADAAHELRTPLAILGLRIQRAKMDDAVDWEPIEREMAQMKRLIDQLMTLARAEALSGGSATKRPVSFSRVVRLAAADMMLLFEKAGRSMEVELNAELWTLGDEGQMRQAVQNLLENSLEHGSGSVRLLLRAEAGCLLLDVGDQGKAPDLTEREEWFKRFRKGRQGGPGSGLGLSIVRQIVRNMGGEVEILDGCRFTVRVSVPLVPAPGTGE